MPNIRQPRSGSLQFWPRKRSKRKIPRVRSQVDSKDLKITGFAGYKVGMTHLQGIETNKYSHKKGDEISVPVTIIECPPLKIATIRLYKKEGLKLVLKKEIILSKDKNLGKIITLPKKDQKSKLEKLNPENYDEVRVLLFTQPHLTTTGQKKPDVLELNVGGSSVEEKINFVKENIDKAILLNTIYQEGDMTDIKSITRGKGFQGPVKRFGITIRARKSEKAIRNPGSLGPWCGQGHIMWRVAHAGKMGYHQRTEYNKQVIKVIENPEEINQKGGMLKYGVIKNPVILVKGSVGGPRKRMILLQNASRTKKKISLPTIEKVNLDSKQGN